jgi:hypothetical protein
MLILVATFTLSEITEQSKQFVTQNISLPGPWIDLAAQAGNASIDGLTSRRDLRTVASRNAKQFHLLSLSTILRAPKMSCGACCAGKSWA